MHILCVCVCVCVCVCMSHTYVYIYVIWFQSNSYGFLQILKKYYM